MNLARAEISLSRARLNPPPEARYNVGMEIPAGIDLEALTLMKYPDAVLAQMSAEVAEVDDDIRRLAGAMSAMMAKADGVGLAAPQVGVPIRMFVTNTAVAGADHGGVYINPRITQRDGSEVVEEGCLSVPGANCRIKRAAVVTITGVGPDGAQFVEQGEGLAARVFQHELDHLDGVLIADRMSTIARLANRRVLKELREAYAARSGGE